MAAAVTHLGVRPRRDSNLQPRSAQPGPPTTNQTASQLRQLLHLRCPPFLYPPLSPPHFAYITTSPCSSTVPIHARFCQSITQYGFPNELSTSYHCSYLLKHRHIITTILFHFCNTSDFSEYIFPQFSLYSYSSASLWR